MKTEYDSDELLIDSSPLVLKSHADAFLSMMGFDSIYDVRKAIKDALKDGK